MCYLGSYYRCGVANEIVWRLNGQAANITFGVVQLASVTLEVNGTLQNNGSIYWSGRVFGEAGVGGAEGTISYSLFYFLH